MSFNAPYFFQQDNTVVLKHIHGKYIRVHPDNTSNIDGNGGTGQYAKWHCELSGNCIKLKNEHSRKYLRIWRNGNFIDVEGGGGPFTLFKIHVIESPNVVRLESERFSGRYISVNENGNVEIGDGKKNCAITFFREGDAILPRFQQQVFQQQQRHHFQRSKENFVPPPVNNNVFGKKPDLGEFTQKYIFKQNNEVVILHTHGEFLRINPETQKLADSHGGTGDYARWKTELENDNEVMKLKSARTNKYLRIHQNGDVLDVDGVGGEYCLFTVHTISDNTVKLESVKYSGRFVAIFPNGFVGVGIGGPNCQLTFFRRPSKEDSVTQPQQIDSLQAQMQAMHIAHEQEKRRLEAQRQSELIAQQQRIIQNLQNQQNQQNQQNKNEIQTSQEGGGLNESEEGEIKETEQGEEGAEEDNLSEATKTVKQWLEPIQMQQHFDTFIQNGFDRLTSIAAITDNDLDKMKIPLGHRKVLIAAARLAPYAGKKIALRSMNYNTHISAGKLDNAKDATCLLDATKALGEEAVWICTQVGEGKMTLSNSKYGGYLRIPKIIDKDACTQHEVDHRCELQIVPAANNPGHVAIFCPTNGNYLSCKGPNLFGTTVVAKPHIGKQECFTIIFR